MFWVRWFHSSFEGRKLKRKKTMFIHTNQPLIKSFFIKKVPILCRISDESALIRYFLRKGRVRVKTGRVKVKRYARDFRTKVISRLWTSTNIHVGHMKNNILNLLWQRSRMLNYSIFEHKKTGNFQEIWNERKKSVSTFSEKYRNNFLVEAFFWVVSKISVSFCFCFSGKTVMSHIMTRNYDSFSVMTQFTANKHRRRMATSQSQRLDICR